jgi:hypothetical protein
VEPPGDKNSKLTLAERVMYEQMIRDRAWANAFPDCDTDLHRKRRAEMRELLPEFVLRPYISVSELREEFEKRFERITDVTFRSRVADYIQIGFLAKLQRGSIPGMKGTETPLRITPKAKASLELYDFYLEEGYAEGRKLGLVVSETFQPGLENEIGRARETYENSVRVTLDEVRRAIDALRDIDKAEAEKSSGKKVASTKAPKKTR